MGTGHGTGKWTDKSIGLDAKAVEVLNGAVDNRLAIKDVFGLFADGNGFEVTGAGWVNIAGMDARFGFDKARKKLPNTKDGLGLIVVVVVVIIASVWWWTL